jgi:hypothetical protein
MVSRANKGEKSGQFVHERRFPSEVAASAWGFKEQCETFGRQELEVTTHGGIRQCRPDGHGERQFTLAVE